MTNPAAAATLRSSSYKVASHIINMNIFKSFASQALDFFETIVLALVIFLLMQAFVAEPHVISGSSMLPNFKNGERIFTQKISYYLNPPARGDVIVFRYPPLPEREYIKRIIGWNR